MDASVVDSLVVPQDLEWPVVGRSRTGAVLVRRDAIAKIEALNDLPPGSLSEYGIVRLLTLWYRERMKLGFPRQVELEALATHHDVA